MLALAALLSVAHAAPGDHISCGEDVQTFALHQSDSDGDGLSDIDEIFSIGTSRTLDDTDGDGLSDHQELCVLDSDPLVPDPIPARIQVSVCLRIVTDAEGLSRLTTTVYTATEATPSGCLLHTPLGNVWDGPDAGLVPVYRHTSADAHRLSLDADSEANEDPDAELLFYGEAVGAGTGDVISTGRYDDTWLVFSAADAPFAWDVQVELFETIAP